MVNKITSPVTNLEAIDKINEIIDNLGTASGANADLSNLSATGQARMDGQWVMVSNAPIELFNGNSRTTDFDLNISSYLPNDAYNYEVFVTTYIATGSTSGNVTCAWLKSDLINATIRIAQCRTRTSSAVNAEGNAIIPTHNRTLTIEGYSGNTGNTRVYLLAYRRIGTNS